VTQVKGGARSSFLLGVSYRSPYLFPISFGIGLAYLA
jgi:hypothetical protein